MRLDAREWVMMRTNRVDKVKKSKMGNLLRWHSRGGEGVGGQTEELKHMKACCKIHRGAKDGLGILHFLMSRGTVGWGVKRNERNGKEPFFLNGIYGASSEILFAPCG